MNTIEYLETAKHFAKDYRLNAAESVIRNNHMNSLKKNEHVKQSHIDAVLVDFLNYIGKKACIDYALYTSDLK